MSDSENIVTPDFTASADEKSSSALPVVIPVIIAGVVGAGAFFVRKLRKKPDTTTPLTVTPMETPASE